MSSITFPIINALDEGFPGTGKPDGPPPFNVPHMLEAPLQSVTSAILIMVYACLITSNLVMLVAYVIEKRLRTYNNFFIINLILTDSRLLSFS